MARRVLYIAVALVLVGFLYLGYTKYDAGRSISNGEVYSNDPPSGKTARSSSATDTSSSAGQAIVYPTPAQTSDSAVPPAINSPAETAQVGQPGVASAATAPAGADTITPNPPNGMVFSGSGKYQLYRQGNITWRLDTETGRSCIIFATDEEWKKPRVLRAGCGKT